MTAEHGHRGEEYERGDAAAYQAAAYAHVDRDEDADAVRRDTRLRPFGFSLAGV